MAIIRPEDLYPEFVNVTRNRFDAALHYLSKFPSSTRETHREPDDSKLDIRRLAKELGFPVKELAIDSERDVTYQDPEWVATHHSKYVGKERMWEELQIVHSTAVGLKGVLENLDLVP